MGSQNAAKKEHSNVSLEIALKIITLSGESNILDSNITEILSQTGGVAKLMM